MNFLGTNRERDTRQQHRQAGKKRQSEEEMGRGNRVKSEAEERMERKLAPSASHKSIHGRGLFTARDSTWQRAAQKLMGQLTPLNVPRTKLTKTTINYRRPTLTHQCWRGWLRFSAVCCAVTVTFDLQNLTQVISRVKFNQDCSSRSWPSWHNGQGCRVRIPIIWILAQGRSQES